MIELYLTVCLLADPLKCKNVSLVYSSENLTPMQCVTRAAPEIAKWQEGHPNYFAKKWGCRPAGREANL